MFLKSVTAHGFKSFADKTEFHFSDGITGIVGPNGCGKSNVLDAVRWVLGEQSAKSLRGARMLDVVFSGSRSRKPANSAEVELKFNNKKRILGRDEDEVSVGRTLYRNGDSEYRINGKVCRLKDVRELFFDTGVGVDAYSVIEQGRVDRLLQASPIERREIFEEAAGISRYKARRIEAQRKLERTQQNLLRLNDVVDELERQLRSVKLAAGKARNYLEYDGRLRELRSAYALSEYHGLTEAEAAGEAQRAEIEADLQRERETLASQSAEAAARDAELRQCDERIQVAEGELRQLESQISTLAERAAQGRTRMAELAAARERRLTQAIEIGNRVESIRAQITQLETDVAALVTQVEENSGRVDELQQQRYEAEARCDAARRSLEAEKGAVFEVVRKAALLQNQIQNLEQQSQRYAAQRTRIDERRAEVGRQRGELDQAHARLDERLGHSEQRVAELHDQLAAVEAGLTELRAAQAALTEQIAERKQERSAVSSRHELLADLERRREGIGAGPQHVLEWRQSPDDGGVIGLVADLIQIDDPRVTVLQHYLSRFEKHVVVHSAEAFFETLDRRGELPAPVEVIGLDRLAATPAADYGTVAGGVTRATEWARCAPEHQPLVDHLLGRVYLVESRAQALKRAEHAPAGIVFVAPSGEVFWSGGRATLGPVSASEGLISRKAELRHLHEQLDELDAELGRLQRERTQRDEEIGDHSVQRDALLSESARVQKELAQLRTDLARLEADQTRLEHAAAELGRELEELGVAEKDLRRQIAEIDSERKDALSIHKSHEIRIDELEGHLRECEQLVARHSQQLTEALVEIGRQAEKRAAAEQSLRELVARLSGFEDERVAAAREAEEAAARIVEVEQASAEAQRRHAELGEQCGVVQAGLVELRRSRGGLRTALDACSSATSRLHERIDELSGGLHACESALREAAVRKENIVARVREELEVDLPTLYAEYAHAEQDWEAIRAEIDDLRAKIQRLGNVNLDAIQDLDALTPRYESLVTQRADLTESIARLSQLITDLDAESHKRFAAAFNEIRSNFQDLFRKLFGGGRADVMLEDPDNPLECGIEVIARPPGKEPQSISLLSGGEKTMTCVALLMAVFKSKPSPFAILDEVDAALDEANVERFSKLLQEFLSVAQFIVITHNKKTMSAADVLYGITMEEPGVSKRVSVRFDDRVHTPNVA